MDWSEGLDRRIDAHNFVIRLLPLLTKRQVTVASLIMQGYTNSEINKLLNKRKSYTWNMLKSIKCQAETLNEEVCY